MKKKFLTFLFTICLIIPCALMLTACGTKEDNKDKEVESVSISFEMDEIYEFPEEYWTVDHSTNTYTTTYGFGTWGDYMFDVIATTESGNTRQLLKATEAQPAGYKIDTNFPAEGTYDPYKGFPVGTYTYRLYVEDYNDGQYQAEACSSPTYTIVVKKMVVDCSDVRWTLCTEPSTNENSMAYCNGDTLQVFLTEDMGAQSFAGRDGIFNFESFEDTMSGNTVGDYVARIDYDIDEANYEYINLPTKTFEWHITKADPMNWISGDLFGYSGPVQLDYVGQVFEMYESTNQLDFHPAGIAITGFEGDYKVSKPGKYTCKPIFTQEDTTNYELINADDFVIEWEILPIVIKPENLYWSYNEFCDYRYDPDRDEPYQVLLDGSTYSGCYFDYEEDLSQNITNTARDAGTYTAKPILKFYEGYEDYYVLEGELPTCVWKIEKMTYDTSNLIWLLSYHNGLEEIAVQETSISSGVCPAKATLSTGTVYPFEITGYETYDADQQIITGDIVEVGKYTTKAVISYNANNIEMDLSKLIFEWSIV